MKRRPARALGSELRPATSMPARTSSSPSAESSLVTQMVKPADQPSLTSRGHCLQALGPWTQRTNGMAVTAAPQGDAAQQWQREATPLLLVELPNYVDISASPKVLC
jgi:hypothetical protein